MLDTKPNYGFQGSIFPWLALLLPSLVKTSPPRHFGTLPSKPSPKPRPDPADLPYLRIVAVNVHAPELCADLQELPIRGNHHHH